MSVAYLNTPLTSGASTPSQGSFAPGTNQVDMRAYCARANWSTGTGAFMANWHTTVANCRYIFQANASGGLTAQWYNAAGALQTCVSTVGMGLANGAAKWVRAIINPGAGTCDFATSDDNVTWTPLGTQITGKTTTAVQTPTAAQPVTVGLDASAANGLAMKLYHSQLRVNNVLLLDIDWTAQAALPTGPWTGIATWTAVGAATINQDDAGTSILSILASSAFAYDAATATFQVTSYGGTAAGAAPAFDSTLFQDCIVAGNARANRMLSYLPPYFRDDPTIRSCICAWAKELDRIEAKAVATRTGAFPSVADLRTLAYYEGLFRLTNTSLTVAQRQADVIAHMRKRKVAERYDWQQALLQFIGSTGWSYAESSPYTVLLSTPVDPTGLRTPVITTFARAITPAHLQLVVNGAFGNFKVGISQIGIDPL